MDGWERRETGDGEGLKGTGREGKGERVEGWDEGKGEGGRVEA